MTSLQNVLTFTDIVICAVTAFLGAVLIRGIQMFRRLRKDKTAFGSPYDFIRAIEKCYSLFPLETMKFNGETITRGMYLRITTIGKKIIEGRFIGANNDEVLCILTKTTISAEMLQNIAGITVIERD